MTSIKREFDDKGIMRGGTFLLRAADAVALVRGSKRKGSFLKK